MKKRVWVVWILMAVLVSIYAIHARNTVNSVDIYFVSYTIGKIYAMTYIVAGVIAVALWVCVIYFFVKYRKQWIAELKVKKAKKKQGMIQQKTVSKLEVKEKASLEMKLEKMQEGKVVQPSAEVTEKAEKVELKEETKQEEKAETKNKKVAEATLETKVEVNTEKKCSSCGATLEENAKFCTKCGNKVT